jgi:hypothetical protein
LPKAGFLRRKSAPDPKTILSALSQLEALADPERCQTAEGVKGSERSGAAGEGRGDVAAERRGGAAGQGTGGAASGSLGWRGPIGRPTLLTDDNDNGVDDDCDDFDYEAANAGQQHMSTENSQLRSQVANLTTTQQMMQAEIAALRAQLEEQQQSLVGVPESRILRAVVASSGSDEAITTGGGVVGKRQSPLTSNRAMVPVEPQPDPSPQDAAASSIAAAARLKPTPPRLPSQTNLLTRSPSGMMGRHLVETEAQSTLVSSSVPVTPRNEEQEGEQEGGGQEQEGGGQEQEETKQGSVADREEGQEEQRRKDEGQEETGSEVQAPPALVAESAAQLPTPRLHQWRGHVDTSYELQVLHYPYYTTHHTHPTHPVHATHATHATHPTRTAGTTGAQHAHDLPANARTLQACPACRAMYTLYHQRRW